MEKKTNGMATISLFLMIWFFNETFQLLIITNFKDMVGFEPTFFQPILNTSIMVEMTGVKPVSTINFPIESTV